MKMFDLSLVILTIRNFELTIGIQKWILHSTVRAEIIMECNKFYSLYSNCPFVERVQCGRQSPCTVSTHSTGAIRNKVNVYLSSLMMKVPEHVYVLG
jgi:hypothetical protein